MIMRALSTDSGAVTFYDGGEHGGHHADGDQLVELGPEQDRVTGDVVHIVPGEGHLPGLERGGVKHQHRPAHDGGDPRQLHVARIEAQHGEDEIPPEDPRRELEGQFRVAAVRGQQE